ncbi:energy-coupling factor transporter transmembrane component T [Candidatus Chloroploca asiatica]|uniref:Cobalt ABC transporter permease n=1 Tax=Candidatus Chloroploca asiatica TaxID=1506545 RepID=A0A2H3L109_9CHLR|nr:energy-coupling factor transporter transmembrane component T [Candidatus Chloroploca asiatica]PDV98347.1 hypothetical protein A9Q02_15805 [Candidatus Chloroploca asiatica]
MTPRSLLLVHPVTWTIWLGTTLLTVSLTRNPLYLLLLLFGLTLVAETERPTGRATPLDPIFFAVIAVSFGALFNAATIRYGDTVLVALPASWWLIGGPITLEAVVFGMINGLVLSALVAGFGAFGTAMPISALISLVPRAFYPLAVVMSVAVTYVPLTIRLAGQVREAQQLRGHQVRVWRDGLPLLLPLLIGGLERALQLAEAMAARGFAADPPSNQVRMMLVGGLAALFAGLLLQFAWGQVVAASLTMLIGTGLILWALRESGQQAPRTRYRLYRRGIRDMIVLLGAGLTLIAVLAPWPGRASLAYTPYPMLQLPIFEPLLALALMGLLMPVAVRLGDRYLP